MIKTAGLTFQHKSKSQKFHFPDIALDGNEHLLVLGKSGIGKTTLLHLMAGLLRPNSGSVLINSVAIHSLTSRKLDAFRGQQIGLVFQKSHALPSLTVYENLEARLFFCKKDINNSAIDLLLEELDIADVKNSKIQALSQGQLQRLGIAMSVIHQPSLILADEPTSSLDDENTAKVMKLLTTQAKKNQANLIVITHDQRIKSYFQNSMYL